MPSSPNKIDLDIFLFGEIFGVTLYDIGRTFIIAALILAIALLVGPVLIAYLLIKELQKAMRQLAECEF